MNEEKLEKLLQRADELAGAPGFGRVSAVEMRRRKQRRRTVKVAAPLTAAAVVAVGLLAILVPPEKPRPDSQRIASLEEQVRHLQAQTEAALKLVREVVAQERQQRRLDALEAELASIRDPGEDVREQSDRAAFSLLYQGDRFDRELNQTQSAIEAYEQVIRVFPDSRWAGEARARLARIKSNGTRDI